MNKQSLQQFTDRANLYHSTRTLFQSDLAIPLKRVTELPVLLPDLLGDNYRDKLHKSINKAYFAGIVDDEAFSAPDTDAAPETQPPETAARAAMEQTNTEDYDGLVIFALDLKNRENNLVPTRSDLAAITRSFNRSFYGHPVAILFRYKAEGSDYISLATCERTPYKHTWREGEKPGKVSLLRDIRIDAPHAGHLRILNDLKIPRTGKKAIQTFDALYQYWQEKLDLSILNKTFYREIAQFFYKLTGGKIKQGSKTEQFERQLHLPSVSPEDAQTYQEFAVRLIGRLIFCWFLKHKGSTSGEPLLPPDLLSADRVAENRNFYHSVLEKLFFEILNTPQKQRKARTLPDADRIPFLNGGLFEPHDKDFYEKAFINTLKIPDQWFSDLFTMLTGYVFTISENTPLDEEVAVDPEILGWIFENLLAEINPETGDTARKKTGSYYTPREIVDYMVTQSLVYSLNEKTGIDEETLRKLMSHDGEDIELSDSQRDSIITALDAIKALDPACGSGAFPMGILQRILLILQRIDTKSRRWLQLKLNRIENTMLRQEVAERLKNENYDYIHKLGIIQNSIFGIDIQPVAVEISKLRFFLSLIVDEKLDDNKPNRGVEPLPNLEFKFVAANTLISAPDEYDEGEQSIGLEDPFFAKFEVLTKDYFSENSPSRKAELREEIETLIHGKAREKYSHINDLSERIRTQHAGASKKKSENALKRHSHELRLWQSYPNIFKDAAVEFFDIKYFFPDAKDGFDIVIGNPPYVRADEASESNQNQREAILKNGKYDTLWEKWDLYVPFIERSYKLLKPNGVTSLIVSDAYCHSKYAQKSQNWFLQNSRILRLDFLSNLNIFDAAVHNLIYFFQRADRTKNKPERLVHEEQFGQTKSLSSDEQKNLTYRVFFPEDSLSDRFTCPTIPLGSACYISVGMVVHADEKRAKGAFELDDVVSEHRDAEHPRRFVEGKHLERWSFSVNRWLEWGTERAPSLFRRPTFPELYVPEEKLFIHRTGGEDVRVSYDVDQTLCNHTIMLCLPWFSLEGVRNRSIRKFTRYDGEKPKRPDLPRRENLENVSKQFVVKYLLAVMNSTVAHEFLRTNRRSNTDLYPDDWKKLPIPDVPKETQQPIVEIVDQILALKKDDPNADIAELEQKVDAMVTELYGIDTATTKTTTNATTPATTAPKGKKSDLKEYLRDECLPELRKRYAYIDSRTLQGEIQSAKFKCTPATLNTYMKEMEKGGFVFSAGKGWYSFIKTAYRLDREPLEQLIPAIKKEFPFLEFACWSTRQVNRYMHHLLGKYVLYVQADRDAMSAVADFLKDAEYEVYLNPTKREVEKSFSVSPEEKTLVIRPLVTKSPVDNHVAEIEKILVDLRMELKTVPLMSVGEFMEMARKTVSSERVNMAELMSYAKRRKTLIKDLLEDPESIISNFARDWI